MSTPTPDLKNDDSFITLTPKLLKSVEKLITLGFAISLITTESITFLSTVVEPQLRLLAESKVVPAAS